MNLFRSEEHVTRWLGEREPGATIPVTTHSRLEQEWWGDPHTPDGKPRTPHQNTAILDRLGLTGSFWRLPGSSLTPPGRERA